MIVAHRGASFDAPENTLAAFREAVVQRADAIECDVWLTRDGHVVATHDESFARCARVDQIVGEMTLAEVKQLDVGAWKSQKFAGERVPTLAEILAFLPGEMRCFVEVKGGREVVDAIANLVAAQSRAARPRLRIIAFDADVIAAAKRAMPDVPAYWLIDLARDPRESTDRPTLATILATLDRVRADGLDAHADGIDAAFAAALRDRGYPLHVWTVDDPALARRMLALGAESLTTNRPALLRDALALGR